MYKNTNLTIIQKTYQLKLDTLTSIFIYKVGPSKLFYIIKKSSADQTASHAHSALGVRKHYLYSVCVPYVSLSS